MLVPVNAGAKSVYVGGTMSLTGPYAEDSAAILAAFEDYVKYVNETKHLAPWRKEKWPADVTLKLLWRDDELKPAKALRIYEELKAKGMLVYRVSGSPIGPCPQGQAETGRLRRPQHGHRAFPAARLPGLSSPITPSIRMTLAAVADWFKANWKENEKAEGGLSHRG